MCWPFRCHLANSARLPVVALLCQVGTGCLQPVGNAAGNRLPMHRAGGFQRVFWVLGQPQVRDHRGAVLTLTACPSTTNLPEVVLEQRAVPIGGVDGAQGSRMALAGALCPWKGEFKAWPHCQEKGLLPLGELSAAELQDHPPRQGNRERRAQGGSGFGSTRLGQQRGCSRVEGEVSTDRL